MDAPLCACGCGQPLVKKDFRGNYRKFLQGHNGWGRFRVPLRNCEVCGTPFRPTGQPKRKLCSIACRTKKLQMARPYQLRQVEKFCFTCGTPVIRKQSRAQAKNFCCQECKNVWMRKAYAQKISEPKKLALQRDRSRCVLCGFDTIVEVHHIHPRRKGGTDDLTNLITLCPNHHVMADRGLISEEQLRRLKR